MSELDEGDILWQIPFGAGGTDQPSGICVLLEVLSDSPLVGIPRLEGTLKCDAVVVEQVVLYSVSLQFTPVNAGSETRC